MKTLHRHTVRDDIEGLIFTGRYLLSKIFDPTWTHALPLDQVLMEKKNMQRQLDEEMEYIMNDMEGRSISEASELRVVNLLTWSG